MGSGQEVPVVVCGSPEERGRILTETTALCREQLHWAKREEFSHLTEEWRRMARCSEDLIRKYCPVAYAELSAEELVRREQLELGVFPEMEAMDHWCPSRCDLCGQLVEPMGLVEGGEDDEAGTDSKWVCEALGCDGYDLCATCHKDRVAEHPAHPHPVVKRPIIPRPTEHSTTDHDDDGQVNKKARLGGLCSVFVLRGDRPEQMVCGQTDEEHPPYNLHGRHTRILKVSCNEGLRSESSPGAFASVPAPPDTSGTPPPWCLLYAFGAQACCTMAGSNSAGLSVLVNTLYVCDNLFYTGVPTLAATRELLSCGRLDVALAYLKFVQPHLAIPLHFMISQPGAGAASVEVSCREIHVRMLDMDTAAHPRAYMVHCNHCLGNSALASREVLPPISTHERQAALERALAKATAELADDELFPAYAEPGFAFRMLGRPPMHNSCVLATMVVVAPQGDMWVRFNQAAAGRRGKKGKRPADPNVGSANVLREGSPITDWRMMDHIASRTPVVHFG